MRTKRSASEELNSDTHTRRQKRDGLNENLKTSVTVTERETQPTKLSPIPDSQKEIDECIRSSSESVHLS